MFGYKKKINELQESLDRLCFEFQCLKDIRESEQKIHFDHVKNLADKIVSESEKKMKQDIDLINFRLDNPKPYELGEIKSGQYKGWIVIGSEVREQRGFFTNDIMGYAWETKIVNKKGETKTINT